MQFKFGAVVIAGLATLLGGIGSASAAVPGWARTFHGTRLDIFGCALQAEQAIQSVTGVAPTRTKLDDFNYEVRGFVGSVGIFAYCTAQPVNICPNRPKADLNILTFSGSSSSDAAAKRDAVNTAFGNPVLIDCN